MKEEFDPLLDAAENGYESPIERAVRESSKGYRWVDSNGKERYIMDTRPFRDCDASILSMIRPSFIIS